MIESRFHNIKITGISAAVSNNWESLENANGGEEKYIKKFIKTTGIKGRYRVNSMQTVSDLAYAAAQQIIKEKDLNRASIGAVIYITQQPDYFTPATACALHHRLGLSEDCLAFDVNQGCSGYIYGIELAASLLNNSNIQKVLMLAGDTPAREKNKDCATNLSNTHRFLFGDAATATLFEKAEDASEIFVGMKTDGAGFRVIANPYGHWRHPDQPIKKVMDEVEVFNFSTSRVPEMINEFFEKEKRSPENYDCLVLHQANLLMMKQIAKKTGFPKEKLLISLDEFGNTSSASIPVTLVKYFSDQTENRELSCLMSGFGIGLTWGIASVKIDTEVILPLVHTDEYFDDGF